MGETYKTTAAKCPLCGHKLYWSCIGRTGWAHCSKSIYAVREWKDRTFCNWKGKVVRGDGDRVYFVIEKNI